MTDAPKTIWVTGNAEMTTGSWNDHPVDHPQNFAYVPQAEIAALQEMNTKLREAADALVAAAYEDAATLFDPKISEANHQEFSLPHVYEGDQAAIRQRTPANAQAAYDAAIAKARREGWEAGRDAAAHVCHIAGMDDKRSGCDGDADASRWCRDAIQALEYKEPET